MRTALATLLLLSLAGCASDTPPPAQDTFDVPEVEAGKGLIRGLVIDSAITPVADAVVRLDSGAEQTTDAEGRFVFADLEPGTYFLRAHKPGWSEIQQATTVVAGVAKPDIVRMLLERLPGTEPRAVTLSAEGFVQCGVGTPLTFHVCPVYDDDDKSTVTVPFEGTPTFIQIETSWESTQPAGEQLYLVYYFCDGSDCGARQDRWSEGVRDTIFVDRTPGNNRTNLQAAVYASPGGPANGTGVALDQQFMVYATFFYNIADPDPDWTFTEDGDYGT